MSGTPAACACARVARDVRVADGGEGRRGVRACAGGYGQRRMACDPLTFTAVDHAKWESVREAVAREYGIRIDSAHGRQSERGLSFRWDYDPASQTLHIQCTGKPFVVPCSAVNKRIGNLAGELGISAS